MKKIISKLKKIAILIGIFFITFPSKIFATPVNLEQLYGPPSPKNSSASPYSPLYQYGK